MDYSIKINDFEGPLDLLLHLIKRSNLDIYDIKIEEITKQYLDYINLMEELNINVAVEYLVMAAELMEIKSRSLLPNINQDNEDEFEEDPREKLIQKLIEYRKYKEVTSKFKILEEARKEIFIKGPDNLNQYVSETKTIDSNEEASLDDLINAFKNFLTNQELNKPLHTKITKKELDIKDRSNDIKSILRIKKNVSFKELFDVLTKEYVVVTFLAILEMVKHNEIEIKQDNNFSEIYLNLKEGE